MSKLNYIQVGRLAKHIQDVMDSYNNTLSPSASAIADLAEMEPWEIKLQSLVNDDSLLPSYDKLQREHEEIIEFLIDYYTPEAAFEREDPFATSTKEDDEKARDDIKQWSVSL